MRKVFGLEVGFFWETVDSDETVHEQYFSPEDLELDTQTTVSLAYKQVFRTPDAMMGILNRVLQLGLDFAGIRLLYPKTPVRDDMTSAAAAAATTKPLRSPLEVLNADGPVLVLALRGTLARTIWLDAVGPSDPALARQTDPKSLCALYGGASRDDCALICPRNASRVSMALCRWFGGRVPPSGVINTGKSPDKQCVRI